MNVYIEETKVKDTIDRFGKGTIIQHGKLNDRIYLIKLDKNDIPDVIDHIHNLALQEAYGKIFCKVPGSSASIFISHGFIIEAIIPQYYNSKEDAFFVSKFLNSDRLLNIEKDKLFNLSLLLSENRKKKLDFPLHHSDQLIQLDSSRAEEISTVFRKVFDSYPFPVFDPEYIRQTMKSHVQYFGVERKKKLIALASAEIDKSGKNAEMTDFATLPEYRGKNLSVSILSAMEKKMQEQQITTLYTIARLNSIPMTKTFLKLNYTYAGTLIKNTNIAGMIESMNVLYKHLPKDPE
jgi:putative beta-lysine N-acetyltransferase